MIEHIADTVFSNNDIPMLLWTFFYLYLLIYGPWVIIPIGLVLVVRLFLIKQRTRRATVIAVSTLAVGVLLAVVALSLRAGGML
ncbi:hypothetical protein KIF24_24120 [Micromonospora sp. Llam7]|uniref:hypothetical protein n=1 Tax=Micromonospora tarapacensis TaxID=2835305 RepID=UPI001C83F1C3|nr:hypothetical protein [Micromonospora tarapacensis]MBX7268799.1 hypothetical protein [Micromonospora tarapacensis]